MKKGKYSIGSVLIYLIIVTFALMFGQLSVNAGTIFFEALDSDPSWTTTGQWAFGQPMGLGAEPFYDPYSGYNYIYGYGYADPTSGYTGNNVYGINLMGDYSLYAYGDQSI